MGFVARCLIAYGMGMLLARLYQLWYACEVERNASVRELARKHMQAMIDDREV